MSFLSLYGQKQQGYVKTKGRLNANGTVTAGQRLTGAIISVLNGNDVMSDDNGKFSMKLSAAQFVLKSVSKKNYVLSDPDFLEKQYKYSPNDFIIVMEDELEKANERKKIERQVRNSLYAQTEKQREEISRLKQENAITEEKYRELLQKVNQEEDDNETIIKDMVEKYSKIDFDQEDDFSRRFSAFLLNGETMRADSLLRSKGDITEDLNKFKAFQDANAQKRAEQAARDSIENRSKAELADRCHKYFELFKTQHKNDSAAYYIEQRANLDTLNSLWQFNAAHHFQDQNQFKQAEKYYVRALEINRRQAKENPQAYEAELLPPLNNLANVYRYTQQFKESEATYKEALEISRRLAKDNPPTYKPNVAQTLNNLATLYHATRRFDEAEAMYKEALEIYQLLAKDDPQAYEPILAQILTNLANHYRTTKRISEAEIETMLKQALEIRRRLAKDNQQHNPHVANTMSKLANFYQDSKRYDEAKVMYEEALEIYQQLAKDNPQAYEQEVAYQLNNLAGLYGEIKQFDESEAMFKEAMKIIRKLAKDNPQVYEPKMALTLSNLAELYSLTQRSSEGKTFLREALEIYQRLAKDNPKVYQEDIKEIEEALKE